jgi:CheY-like chemotaxis protein
MSAKRILVVDDEEPIRQVVRLVLGGAGFQVAEATDGEDALRQVARLGSAFDLILLDQNMPGMSGTETFRHLLAHLPASRIVLLSGIVLLDPERIQALGAQRVLPKPFANEELIRMVRDAVEG